MFGLSAGLMLLTVPGALWAGDPAAKAIAFVEKLGGTVTRDKSLLEDDVDGVDLRHVTVTDAALKELAVITNLKELDRFDTKVTDAGLKHLAALKQLQILDIGGTKVTNEWLKQLVTFKHLQHLGINST